jgi:hypothetical protein
MGFPKLTNLSERRDAMNAHGFRTMFSRQNVVPFTLFFLLFIVVVFGLAVGMEQSAAKERAISQLPQGTPGPTGEDIKKEFNDDDLKVKEDKARGKWGVGLMQDEGQFNDPSAPVVVVGIQLLSGGGKYVGVNKIKRVKINNRSPKIVSSVQLRWTIAGLDDREKVLAEGITPFANIWVEANISQVIEIQTLYPAQLLKRLAKNGELYGEFMITIGIQEARFADGSFWRRPTLAALLTLPYNK